MKYLISDLIAGMDHIEEFCGWIESCQRPDFGVELTAFTHDDAFWQRLSSLVPRVRCPMTFHGPYVNIEATSPLDSAAHRWLMESYDKVFRLAAVNSVRHVVFHYSQKQFDREELPAAQANAYRVMQDLQVLSRQYGVNFVIENLCRQKQKHHLFTNDEYFQIFERFPEALSLIDIGHAHVNGLDVEKFLALYGKRVKGVHVHNNDGKSDQHKDYRLGTADIRRIMHWIGRYTEDTNIVIEYEPHERLSHAELLEEIDELKSWTEEGAGENAAVR